jgi:hypothetical protein
MKVPFGLMDGRMWAIDEVPTGLSCGCVCPGCGRALVAKNREGNQHISHFAHYNTSDCATGAETALHLDAKQIIDERRQLFLPDLVATSLFRHRHLPETLHDYTRISQGGLQVLADVVLEQGIGPIRPDLRVVDTEGQTVLVEVAVTHFVDEHKRARAELLGLPMVEFDLSELPRFDFASLEAVLFQYTDSARWIHHPLIEAERDRQRQTFEAGLNDPTSCG